MQTLDSFRILTVCTGNICRSPVSEVLLQAGFDEIHPGAFTVRSAGTNALTGQPMQPMSMDLVERNGATGRHFVSRQLTASMIREADLVLAMAAEHRAAILQTEPAALKRTFTLREFARMLERVMQDDAVSELNGDVPGFWRGLPAAAAGVRHKVLARSPLDNDVVDPYRRSSETYRKMEEQLVPAISTILSMAALQTRSGDGRRRSG